MDGAELSDDEAIRRLILQYPAAVDNGDVAGVAALFSGARLTMGAGITLEGEEQIREFFSRSLKVYPGGHTYVRHHVTNVLIDVDGETATSTSYYVTFQQVPGVLPLQPIIAGEYEDEFRRTDGVWRFTARRFTPLMRGDISHHVTGASGWDPGGR